MSTRYALVTGGASGMGKATVARLARDGFEVFMVDRNIDLAEREAAALREQGLNVTARGVDITDEPAVQALIAELPALNVLVNNAGIFDERLFAEASSADFRRMYEINTIAVHTMTQAVAERMQAGGKVVIVASRAYLGARNHVHYVASKAAVVGYTRAVAMELAPRNIAVNAIAPGLIDTPLLQSLSPERRKAQEALQPTGRAGQPEDVANAVAFFANPLTDFVTGQVLFVDGGKSLGGSYS
ncbi:MAG: SDR family NAD(P)-dependent oxidoreductase [Pseudomonas sp.]